MYFPKNQIVTDLYSDGVLVFKNNPDNIYTGPYWRTSKGQFFSGKTPQDSPIFELILPLFNRDSSNNNNNNLQPVTYYAVDSTDTEYSLNEYNNLTEQTTEAYKTGLFTGEYISIKNLDPNFKTSIPVYIANIPSENDYKIGEFRRYFCKKVNELMYIEIDKEQYDLLKNKNQKILYEHYQPFDIPWKINGNKDFVKNVNFNMVQLTMFRQKLPMFNKYIREDYLKYYK